MSGPSYNSPLYYDDPSYTYGGEYIGSVGSSFADLSSFYSLAPEGFAVQARVNIVPYDTGRSYDSPLIAYEQNSWSFPALLDTADESFYEDRGSLTTHTLRYQYGIPLKAGDQVIIGIDAYTVIQIPRRINRDELRAHLAYQGA